ncbi:ABC transporter substrate-binding protein [Bradyrhizobium semiaridum]|uniref:ABC transporter substrate-binding protein n=1 Tax=Bradyrhizobium semiaridum TaxID=2821404 RepID=UPI00289BC901|nr:ABC transporter substrate-binding protein [Bradyrhizobium semiaridum]
MGVSLLAHQAAAEEPPLKIGVLEDMSGVYADATGMGSVVSAQLAAEDFGAVLGRKVEIVYADTVSKPDTAVAIAKRWIDLDGVEMVTGTGSSAVGLAARTVLSARGKIDIVTTGGSSDLTGKACSPTSFHWVFDTYALAKTIGAATVKSGADTFFTIATDNAFGTAMTRDGIQFGIAAGGKSLGEVRVPINTADYSSFILRAQSTHAKAILLGLAGQDIVNFIKQADEFNVVGGGQKLASFVTYATDVHALGLKVTQGLLLSEAFYWDLNDETRAFAKRYFERQKRMPNSIQAGAYSAVKHYLTAVKAAGTADGKVVAAKMRELPVNDFMTANGKVREDGRLLRDFYLFQVKSPAESTGEWDMLKVVQKLTGEEAFRPLADSACPLVRK